MPFITENNSRKYSQSPVRQLADSILDYRTQIKHMRESIRDHRAALSKLSSPQNTNLQSIMRKSARHSRQASSGQKISFKFDGLNQDSDSDSLDECVHRMLYYRRMDTANKTTVKDLVKFRQALTAHKLNIVPKYSHYDTMVRKGTPHQEQQNLKVKLQSSDGYIEKVSKQIAQLRKENHEFKALIAQTEKLKNRSSFGPNYTETTQR